MTAPVRRIDGLDVTVLEADGGATCAHCGCPDVIRGSVAIADADGHPDRIIRHASCTRCLTDQPT